MHTKPSHVIKKHTLKSPLISRLISLNDEKDPHDLNNL